MDVFDGSMRCKLEEKYSNPDIFRELIEEAYYKVNVKNVQEKIYLDVDTDGTGKKEFFICTTCKSSFMSNKLPSCCILNECRAADQPTRHEI